MLHLIKIILIILSDRVYQESEAYRRSNGRAIALSVAFQPLIWFLILLGFVLLPRQSNTMHLPSP
ncbi:MAG: hypothetical protein MUF49_03770 [Oculatellaceae cyanobacterium Prado106]|nr:hypothetical protein [Oculatellaceae cyanobacterium Prado106]